MKARSKARPARPSHRRIFAAADAQYVAMLEILVEKVADHIANPKASRKPPLGPMPTARQSHARFGRNLCAERRKAGLTQAELAKRVKLTRARIGALERGETDVSMKLMFRLAAAMDTSAVNLTKGL
ncbi:MAG: helix-turn-helix transcriptional regulator [Chthoniobacteraceae bacterium]